MSKLQIFLNKKVFNRPIYLDQYDKDVPVEFEILNADGTPYVFKQGDYPRLDIAVGDTIAVINTINDFTMQDNIVTWNSKREVTVTPGKGTMNFYICNSITGKRIGSFKREIIVENATLDENAVSSELTITAIEILEQKSNQANGVLDELNEAIENADLTSFAKKTEVLGALDVKRDKADKIKSSDLDTSTNANKIQQNNLSDEVKQMMTGTTPVNAVPADKSIAEEKITNNSLSSLVLKGQKGRILQKNALVVTLGATITVKSNRNISIFYDNTQTYISTNINLSISSAITKEYCLYLNLENNQIEIGLLTSLTMPCVILALLYNNIAGGSTQIALYGNDESIIVKLNNTRIQDKALSYVVGVVSYNRKINITYTGNTLDIEYLNGTSTTIFVNGQMYSGITNKESFTITTTGAPFNLLFDITNKKLFFAYGDTDVSLFASDNNSIVLLCSFLRSGEIINIAKQSTHNILFNGIDNTDTNPISAADKLWDNTEFSFGLNTADANVPQESYGSKIVHGMVSTICSQNSRWNKVYKSGAWQEAYDDGKGGHGLEVFSKDLSYRYTVLLDYREPDDFPVASVQLFQRNGAPVNRQFGWVRIGCDDYSKTTYGNVGGWMFRDSLAKANCPVLFEKRPLPTSLPTNYDEIAPLDDRPILACDLNGIMRIWDYGTKRWLKIITEKEFEQKEMLINKSFGVENAFYVLPNGTKNDVVVVNHKPYKVKRISSYTLNGTETWTINASGTDAIRFACENLVMDNYNLDYANSNTNMLSDTVSCRWVSTATLTEEENLVIMGRNVKGFFLIVRKTLATDVATLKTYLASNNIKVYYQLAAEVTTEII